MFYELATGRIVTETDLKLAYEIYTGQKADERSFRRWVNNCPTQRIPEREITVERLINGDAFVQAVRLYKEQHNCTLSEAKDACDKIRNGKE